MIELAIIAVICLILGRFSAHKQISLYKGRWQTATRLLEDHTNSLEEENSTVVNGWKIETYTAPGHYLSDTSRQLEFARIRLVKDRQKIEIVPSAIQVGIGVDVEDFAGEMKRYRKKAEAVAKTL